MNPNPLSVAELSGRLAQVAMRKAQVRAQERVLKAERVLLESQELELIGALQAASQPNNSADMRAPGTLERAARLQAQGAAAPDENLAVGFPSAAEDLPHEHPGQPQE